jgi:NAD/NADP transhydrogenase beta subunit
LGNEAALKWEKKRKMGKSKYVLWYGAIGLGLSVAILLTLIEFATEKRINASWVFIRLLVFPIIGSLISNARWSNQENRYSEYQQIHEKG